MTDREKMNAPRKRMSKKSLLLRIFGYIMKYWYFFIPAIIMTLISNQLALMGPLYSGYAIDALSCEGGVNMPVLWENVAKMVICYVLSAIIGYILAILMIKISQGIAYTLRKQIFEKLTTLPVGFFDTTATGNIISVISYDVDTLNTSISSDFVQVMTSLYTVIGSLAFMWHISKPLVFIFAFTVPASVIYTKYRSKKVRPLFRKRSAKLGELNGYGEELLSGTTTISLYNREKVMEKRFAEHNHEAMDAYYDAEYYSSVLWPVVGFINNISLSLIMIFGGILYMYSETGAVRAGSVFFITLGGVAQFIQYSRKFAGPINEFANIIHEFQSAFSAGERIFRIIDSESEPTDAEDAKELKDTRGEVEFLKVSFGYNADDIILNDVSLKANPGETIAVVGPTGAGKTTIINLLMRFYDANKGNIKVDGEEIKSLKRKSLRQAYTMVLQDTWLFNGTIFENIAYGKENVTVEEVRKVAKMARIDDFIEKLPLGYDTVLSDDGVNISKGQKQLITIARAMLSDAPMLILDEATSNVDSRTEIKIQKAMAQLMKGRTAFVIAHRLSTIKDADKILVVQDGRITESGNHRELMEKGGFYSTLYNSQFN